MSRRLTCLIYLVKLRGLRLDGDGYIYIFIFFKSNGILETSSRNDVTSFVDDLPFNSKIPSMKKNHNLAFI
jgi:hypothetical protein